MKKTLHTVLLLLAVFCFSRASAQLFNWVSKVEATSFNYGYMYVRNSAVDSQGNVYVVGAYNKSIFLNNTTIAGSFNSTYGIIFKLNRNGNFLWIKTLQGNDPFSTLERCDVSAIALDGNGGVYLTGSYSGTIDFGPDALTNYMTSSGDKDIFIAKWDTSGTPVWTKSIGGATEDLAEAITVKSDGSQVYTTGSFTGTVDFDPSVGSTSSLTAASAKDGYVLCLDGAGGFSWLKGILGSGTQSGLGVCMNAAQDHVYVAGTFEGTTAFASAGALNITSNGMSDGFVGKYNAASGGNPVWVKRIGGVEADEMRAVKQDRKSDNIYVGGTFRVNVDFDPGAGIDTATSVGISYGPTNPHTDAFLVKLDENGNYIWKNIHSNPALLSLAEIDVDINGFVYSVGSFTGTATTSHGVTNIFATSQGWVTKIDSTGANIWSGSFGQQQYDDDGTTVCVSDSLDINVGGDYNRGSPNGYTFNVDFAGGSTTTPNGFMSAISQHSQKRPTLVSMYLSYANWNYAGIAYNWNPEGAATTLVTEYGTTMSLGTTLPAIALGSGTSNVFNVETILGTIGGTKYYYRMTATNTHGSTVSWIDSFTTPVGPIPVVTVLDTAIFGPVVTNITNDGATITNVDVAANNLTTTVSIEYGLTTAYGSTWATTPATVTGNSPTSVSAVLSGLAPGLYHFRVKATNAAGSAYSGDYTFQVGTPLSLQWKSFTAIDLQHAVTLQWETFNEVNVNYFDAQTSTDGTHWKSIGRVQAQNNPINTYHLNDQTSFSGTRFYRIKQVDVDNRYTYSIVEKINRLQNELFKIYPNPATSQLTVETNTVARVDIFALDGKKVYSKQITPSDRVLSLSSLAKGSHYLRITTSENETFTRYFVIQ